MDLHGTEGARSILIMIIYWMLSALITITFVEVYPDAGVAVVGMVSITSMCASYQICKLIGD